MPPPPHTDTHSWYESDWVWHGLQALDTFLAGDDVPAKKPDPSIYALAAERLGVHPSECLVIEDSAIGLQVAPLSLRYPTLQPTILH